MHNFTKNDFLILRSVYKRKATTEMISVTIATIKEDTGLSYVKIRNTLKLFTEKEFIKEGFKQGNAKTFFITTKGIDKLVQIMGGEKNE